LFFTFRVSVLFNTTEMFPLEDGPHLVLPAHALEGVEIGVQRAVALPSDIDRWREAVLDDRVLVDILATTTTTGWPVQLVHARAADVRDPRRTMFALFELFDRGVVVTLTVRDAEAVASRRAAILAFVRAADIERTSRSVVALAQLWEPS
jgi:hypothetical protein